jgi:AraC-like DNA-binding protein/quercetin dioxygenase-like cupin family protein
MEKIREGAASSHDLARLHEQRLAWLEEAGGDVLALPTEYPDGHRVKPHRHSRSQLLHALTGVVMVSTSEGRWMVPPDHAIWLPAGVEHAVEMLGDVAMRSIYVRPDALDGLPRDLRVVAVTSLMRSLIVEAVTLAPNPQPGSRAAFVMGLLMHEIPNLPPRPLGLPFPAESRLAALCRSFVAAPSPHATIDGWARTLGMSRRTFTRSFHRETGLSLSTWRQQACLFAALPRLADGEPITSVALDLGYESVPAFTTMFKRMLGEAPRNYFSGRHHVGPAGGLRPAPAGQAAARSAAIGI